MGFFASFGISSTMLLATLMSLLLAVQAYNTTNYTNPIIFSDFADNDVAIGPDGAYYFSGSSFQFSPGAPILKSHDLVNWELIGHSVPMLDFGPGYNMTGTPNYVGGIWASTMRYRNSTGLWYWIGCVNFWQTYIYTASEVTGPWKQSAVTPGGTCYYDCGLLIDDDDTMYVVYGNTNVSIAQLAPDGLSQVKTQHVFSGPTDLQGIEGNRLYKINGTYYVLDDAPSGTTFIWKSSNIWGPWTYKILQSNIRAPAPLQGLIDQGSLVQAPDGGWYFVSCSWDYPAGRIPVMAPIVWGEDGWPSLVEVDGAWGASYPYPTSSPSMISSTTEEDPFDGTSLGPQWEWNFNPDTTKFKVDNGLLMSTVTVTNDIYTARNTLTHRFYGSEPNGTVEFDLTSMADGDRAGFAAFRDQSAWIEVNRSGANFLVRTVHNATQDPNNNWETINNGTVMASAALNTTQIWLKAGLHVLPSSDRQATFSYSVDGKVFQKLGPSFVMTTDYHYFTGYRFAIFNFATKALGGTLKVLSFKST